jgi:hypothetical protein
MSAAPKKCDEAMRRVIIDLLRQLEGVKKKLKDLLDT